MELSIELNLYKLPVRLGKVWVQSVAQAPIEESCQQSGALQWSEVRSEIMMLLRQLSYAIKNQLKAPQAAY